jgi:hypothetical protein
MFKNLFKGVLAFVVLTLLFNAILLKSGIVERYVTNVAVLSASSEQEPVELSFEKTATDVDFQDLKGKWRTEYGISIITSTNSNHNYNYRWEILDDTALNESDNYWTMLDDELSLYTSRFFERVHLRSIVLVEELESIEGVPTLGFADINQGVLYLNVKDKRANTSLVKSTIHHEIGHFLSFASYGYDIFGSSEWNAISQTDYSSDEANEGDIYYPAEGFVSNYAQSSAAEDMAEVFAFVMTREYRADLSEHLRIDPVLSQKTSAIEEMVRSADPTIWPAI